MNKNIEKEYKILVTKDQFEILSRQFDNLNFITQINTYYDTANMDIRNNKGAMRIRERNGKYIFTLKMKDKNIDGHYEFEMEVSENNTDVFKNPDIKNLLNSYGIHDDVIPLTTLETKRAVINTGDAEICFDINSYNGIIDYEIEYEYIKPHDGLTIFQELLSHANLIYKKNSTSKIQRALNSIYS